MAASIFDDFPSPSSARLLGWELRGFDAETKTIEIGFAIDDRFLNPAGTVQGGFLAAMLDDTQGPALFAATDGQVYAPTIDFHIVCLRPALPGRFLGRGRVVNVGKTIAVTEAELFDEGGDLVARGTFTGRVREGAMARRD
ncbi:MAG: PaaI family thioesterase [Sphingomonas sp.]|uniref:PaaI family thioesterase n=1 Tax=Sphingomonas sp. TaxID=28214 RepID=UPI001B1D1C5A|nr:PaaI family thioesterase [Sphingomonas sp.]MBO9621500.1 PaaI family thioesterase [Sphingomonas sp.]